ncbi:MAG: hypothetical protein JWO36_6905 [Myxococcales bacterium]|nr:hypothetical protein [Myxococcales bacterium]
MDKILSGFLLFAIVGCTNATTTPPVSRWSLAQLGAGDLHATGVAINRTTGNLWFLARGVGLVEATPAGQHVSTLPFDASFVDHGFTDVTVLDDGSFALTANGEGYRYDRLHGETSFFCLVPGGDQTTMDNEAITLDPSTGTMYVAPAYFIGPNLVSARISGYAASDGHLMSDLDVMPTGVLAQGMAVDSSEGAQRMWIVQHDTMYRFTMDGTVDGSTALAGVSEAAGVALVAGQLYVLDGTNQDIRAFDRDAVVAGLR